MPEVSVIIAAYNAEAVIGECLRSALAQSLADLEVIVVDDGSRDQTSEVVRGIGDSRVRLVRQENRGQSAALNAGIALATGRYFKFLDADDCLNPEHLAAQRKVLDGFPNAVASCRWGYFVDDAKRPAIRTEAVQRDFEDPLEWLVTSLTCDEGMMGGWMWLIPAPVVGRCGGWDDRLSLNNDFDFSIRLLLASSGVRYARDAVYCYRKSLSGTLSGSKGRRAMESAWLTTESGSNALLRREDSERIRRICADRFQSWLFQFYPNYPDLAAKAEVRIRELGGSRLTFPGGRIGRELAERIGWRRVRRLQEWALRLGWNRLRELKNRKRLAAVANAQPKAMPGSEVRQEAH